MRNCHGVWDITTIRTSYTRQRGKGREFYVEFYLRLHFNVIQFLDPLLKLHLAATFCPVKLDRTYDEWILSLAKVKYFITQSGHFQDFYSVNSQRFHLQSFNCWCLLSGMSTDLSVISSPCWATPQRSCTPWWTSSLLSRRRTNIDHWSLLNISMTPSYCDSKQQKIVILS